MDILTRLGMMDGREGYGKGIEIPTGMVEYEGPTPVESLY